MFWNLTLQLSNSSLPRSLEGCTCYIGKSVKIYLFVLCNIFCLNMYWQTANLCTLWMKHLSNVTIKKHKKMHCTVCFSAEPSSKLPCLFIYESIKTGWIETVCFTYIPKLNLGRVQDAHF